MTFLITFLSLICIGFLISTYLIYGLRIKEFKKIKKGLFFPEFTREFNKFCYPSLYENVDEKGVDFSDAFTGFWQWIIYKIDFLPRKNEKPLRFFKKK